MIEPATQSSQGHGNAMAGNEGTAYAYNYNFNGTLPPAITRAVHLNPLPALFLGREPELAALHALLSHEGGVAFIPGQPGRGKSTLANVYAHRHAAVFDSVHWLPCQGNSLVKIAAEFASQLDLKLEGDLPVNLRQLRNHCAHNRCLLVLDNVEDETPAGMLLGGRCSVLVTTWHTNLRFLRDFRPGVSLPDLTEEQCFELFRNKIGALQVDRHPNECRLLFRRLEFHPKALDVAAGLIADDVRHTIASMARNPPKDIAALFDEAIAALSPAARELLAAMAACAPGGFRLALAAQIAGFDEDTAFDALNQLLNRSLAEGDPDTHRYRLHSLVRDAAQPSNALRTWHAEAVNAQFTEWQKNRIRCEEDWADWRTAFAWTLEKQEDNSTWSTAKDLAFYGFQLSRHLGRYTEAYEMWQQTDRMAANRDDVWCLAASYSNQALILKDWGRLNEAMDLHKKEEALRIRLGDKVGLAASYGNQAVILKLWKQLNEAMDLHKKEEALAVETSYKVCLQRSYGNQAGILQDWGQLDHAMDLHKKEEALCLELYDELGLQRSYGNQTLILIRWGRLDDALALHKKAEAICVKLGAPRELAYCYWQWSETAKARGDVVIRRDKLREAFALFTKLKMSREIELIQAEFDEDRDVILSD